MSANRYNKVVFVVLTFLAFAFIELFANKALVYLIAGGICTLIKFTANRCEIFFIDMTWLSSIVISIYAYRKSEHKVIKFFVLLIMFALLYLIDFLCMQIENYYSYKKRLRTVFPIQFLNK